MIEALFRHMEWADATVWRAIAATPGAENDQKLRDRLLHLHTCSTPTCRSGAARSR